LTQDNHLLGKFNLEGIPPSPRGIPQIEVSFDLDANGILNVHATDKATGKAERITITNEKGRLSKEEIENMVRESERFRAQDEEARKRVEAKNGLEGYTYGLRNTLNDPNMKQKIPQNDRETLESKIQEILKWVEDNPNAAVNQYESKQKELEGISNPIMTKMYQSEAPQEGGMPSGGFPGGFQGQAPQAASGRGPDVEEVD